MQISTNRVGLIIHSRADARPWYAVVIGWWPLVLSVNINRRDGEPGSFQIWTFSPWLTPHYSKSSFPPKRITP